MRASATIREATIPRASLGAITHGAAIEAELMERDLGAPSARTSSKGALIAETHAVFRAFRQGMSVTALKEACLRGSVLRHSARHTRARIWDAINWRFFSWEPPAWILKDLREAALEAARPSQRFTGLVYLHYARRDRLTFDFVTERIFQGWRGGVRGVRREEVWRFAVERYGDAIVGRFRESTQKKIAGNVLSALRDFGVLSGVQRKMIEQPRLDLAVGLHLCRLLYEEGLRGRELTESLDWRLFLLAAHEVTKVLAALAGRGAIRFEQAGRTVILELRGDGA
jgi:hypothetical protein